MEAACMDVIGSHKDLIVWQKSIALAGAVYAATRMLPSEERLGLIRQLRHSSVSIASNIARGSACASRAELRHSLHVARGSLLELETQVLIAARLSYLTKEKCQDIMKLAAEVGRLLNGLMSSLTR